MRDYQKLVAFIAVLLFSVSLMSVAFDLLGDISDVELDMEPKDEETSSVASDARDAEKVKGKAVKVEGSPSGEVAILFEIQSPPRTKYLRQTVGEIYENGEWRMSEDHVPVSYDGGDLDLTVSGYTSFNPVSFTIRPLFNISGFIPSTLSVINIDFEQTLERYPSLELFSAPEPFSSAYGVTYVNYEFSRVTLLEAEILPHESYLEVPEEIEKRFRDLASRVVEDSSSPWEQLKALETYIKRTYEYNDTYTPAPLEADPVEWFLFHEMKGKCSHFNSAFALLARSLGIPARVVEGYLISSDAEYQLVTPSKAHLWVEVPFEDLSWMTFDATPETPEEKPVEIERIPTVTNITHNDPLAIKGGYFWVLGTVTTHNGSAVDGVSVEVFLTVRKNETGFRCGTGIVRAGVFNITCDAAPSLKVGDYDLVAHSLGSRVYEESWSDPPIRIMAETEVSIETYSRTYVGDNITFVGTLTDKSSGQPIHNATISFLAENEIINITTDEMGTAYLSRIYDTDGNKTVSMFMKDSRYYLGSNSTFGVAVTMPPPPRHGILTMLAVFPYNVILAAGVAVSVGAVVILRRRSEQPSTPQAAPRVPRGEEIDLELPLTFKDFKEGIVKLFNRFYASVRRRYPEISDSMTPREFQQALLKRISSGGSAALEYLVTAFEIADYSTSDPTEEMYEKCLTAIELLSRLMGNG